jgi:hypothetical protein
MAIENGHAAFLEYQLLLELQGLAILPRYMPRPWPFEADVYQVTQAGYGTEYEIKVTRADFRADARKSWRGVRKHERLAQHDVRGPSRFWYVVPQGLVPESEVPEWAGIIEGEAWECYGGQRYRLRRTRPAPRLHKEKVSPKLLEHMAHCAAQRYVRLVMDRLREAIAKEKPDGNNS